MSGAAQVFLILGKNMCRPYENRRHFCEQYSRYGTPARSLRKKGARGVQCVWILSKSGKNRMKNATCLYTNVILSLVHPSVKEIVTLVRIFSGPFSAVFGASGPKSARFSASWPIYRPIFRSISPKRFLMISRAFAAPTGGFFPALSFFARKRDSSCKNNWHSPLHPVW